MKRMTLALCLVAAACAVLSIMAAPAMAEYPEKPITILCMSKPGSTMDLMGRKIAKISEKFVGQPMSVVTKAGGGGTVALAHLLKQKPDGYNILTIGIGYAFIMARGKTKMKPDDFAPICRLAQNVSMMAVNAQRPYDTWQKFVEYAKKHPNTIKMAHAGVGQAHHVFWLRVKKAAGIELRDVPYHGGGPAVTSCVGGHNDAVVNNPSIIKPHMDTGKLKGIYVYGRKRVDIIPDVPTLKELGVDIEEYIWRGMITRAGVPRDRIEHIARAFKEMTKDPEWIQFIKKFVWEPEYMGPDEFTKLINQDIKKGRETLIDVGLVKN